MAEAIIRGLIETGRTVPAQLVAVNHQNHARLQSLKNRYGIRIAESPDKRKAEIQSADIVVLAMKPKDAGKALTEIRPLISERQLIISVIAGLSIDTIASHLPDHVSIVRTMPNTSSTIGCGATGIAFSTHVTEQEQKEAIEMFEAIGVAVHVDEPMFDLITGLSGSGPAYVYYLMEAMISAATAGGMSKDMAKKLVAQTVYGAAKMVMETDEEPEVLRNRVTSPGGTTEAALNLMKERGFPEIVQGAVKRAAERAKELGEETKGSFNSISS